jgi:hypothetical protein
LLDLEGADKEELMIISEVKIVEVRLPGSLTDEKEFLVWKKPKECERRKKIKAEEYAATQKRSNISCGGSELRTIAIRRNGSWIRNGGRM